MTRSRGIQTVAISESARARRRRGDRERLPAGGRAGRRPVQGGLTCNGTCGWLPPSAASGGPRICGGCSPTRAWRSRWARCRTCGRAGRSRSASTTWTSSARCSAASRVTCWSATPAPERRLAVRNRALPHRVPQRSGPPSRRPVAAAGMSSPALPVITCTTCGATGPGHPRIGLCKRCKALPSTRCGHARAADRLAGTWPPGCAPAVTGWRGPGWSSARAAASCGRSTSATSASAASGGRLRGRCLPGLWETGGAAVVGPLPHLPCPVL